MAAKEKITNSYNSHDRLMTMAASVVVATAYSNCRRWQWTAAVLYVVWALQGTDSWQTMHMEQTESKFNGNIVKIKSMLENGEGFLSF
jgi:hypothetical protein